MRSMTPDSIMAAVAPITVATGLAYIAAVIAALAIGGIAELFRTRKWKMKTLLAAATLGLTLLTSPAHAGSSCWNGRCWNHGGGGISPGAAVALGLGSLALGTALANPYAYPWRPPTVIVPAYYPPLVYVPRLCWNGYTQFVC